MSGLSRRVLFVCLVVGFPLSAAEPEPIRPTKTLRLFNGKNLDGFTTWLKGSGTADPTGVFSVKDGVIHVSGTGNGYLATRDAYRDYHLTVEYRWGEKTFGSKYVRNSGVLLHGTGPDGGAGGTWMASIECQLAQGCVGDLIVIPGKTADGKPIAVQITSKVKLGPDRRPRGTPRASRAPSPAASCGGTATTPTSRNSSTPAASTTWKARSASGRGWSASAPAAPSP